MEIKCKNCGQFINGDDKYCRFCGCPTPTPEKPKEKMNVRQISDAIQEEKVSIHEEEILNSEYLKYEDINIKSKGNVNGLRFRSIILAIVSITVCLAAFVSAMLLAKLESNWNNTVKYILLMLSIIIIFIALIYAIDYISKIKLYSSLVEKTIIIPRFSLRGAPIFVIGGFVFIMDVDKPCPHCNGDIIGDLHFEKIHDQLVAVCNYNRKHFYRVNENEFFDYCLGKIKNNASLDINTSSNNHIPQSATEHNKQNNDVNSSDIE